MDAFLEIAAVITLSCVMSAVAYYMRLLTKGGTIASFITGSVIGVFGGLDHFILLFLFTAAGFAATRMGLLKKKKEGLQEGQHGERTHMNVLGVAIAPCIFAVISYLSGGHVLADIAFIASIAVAAADTIGSEIGVKDKNVWMITTFKKVPAGTDGGISKFGTIASLAGAAAVAVFGWIVLFRSADALMIIPAAAGFLGCLADSIFGATIETKGYISKYTNNASTAVIGALLSIAAAYPFV